MLTPMDTTGHDLKLLSIGYYVQGGIVTFYSFLALCYVGFMGVVLSNLMKAPGASPEQIPSWLLPLIGTVVTVIVLLMVAVGLCMIYAGMALRRRKHRVFLLVMAALNCMSIPYGTILGIFTFIVLNRPAAKALFGSPLPPPISPQLPADS